MKMKSLLFIIVSFLTLAGCSGNPSNSNETDPSFKQTTVTVDSCYDEKESPRKYDFTFTYRDSLFDKPATKFNKDLSLLSYGFSIANSNKDPLSTFLNDLDFKRAKFSEEYDSNPKASSVGYVFATKQLDDCILVAASIRGFNYKIQWANNFLVGTKGNHQGFNDAADIVNAELTKYLIRLDSDLPVKLWLTGYSRGGAIANIMASKIIDNPIYDISKENFYVYTFCAPKGLVKENAVAYENVFNIINGGDVLAKAWPEEYGFYRCGIDVDIYRFDIDDLIKEYDPDAIIPKFKSSNLEYTDDKELADYLLQCLLKQEEYEEGEDNWSASTRELFNQNYGDDLRYILTIIMTLENVTLEDFIRAAQNLSTTDLLLIMFQVSNFIDYVKGLFDDFSVTYEEESLIPALSDIYNFVTQPAVLSLITIISSKDRGPRVINMHRPDTNYILLNAFNKSI